MILGLFAAAPLQRAEAAGFYVQVPGGREVQLALPRPATPQGDPDGKAEEIWSTIDNDLRQSGYFTLIDPEAAIDGGGVEPGSFTFDSWTKLKVGVVVKTRILPTGQCGKPDAMCVDAYVYYVVNGETLAQKRFRSEAKNARYIGHDVANEVVEAVTGQRSSFGARLAAVGKKGANKEIFLLDTDGKGVAPVTKNGSINLSPAVSPDGRYVSWTSYRKGNPDLYVKDLASGHTRVLSNVEGINASPAFSPDGRYVAMARSTGGNSDIYILDAKTGKDVKRLTDNAGIDVSPNYSPDGTQIAFASEASGGSQIYVADAASGASHRVTHQGGFNTDPVFSPDGTKIAFVGRDKGGFDVFVVGADGKGLIRITQGMGDNEDPSWSPDGRYLVFSSTRNGTSQIWISTADGRHQAPVTSSGSWTQPTFVP
ncbi:MAG: Tol-Pal system beta propeller repeat protein TolB [Alphaproteobacteria bacterium]|nr:Tol-Pal system beta propeller repeat protein TolB [Alphaproteobacteria bacterium]